MLSTVELYLVLIQHIESRPCHSHEEPLMIPCGEDSRARRENVRSLAWDRMIHYSLIILGLRPTEC